MTTQSIPTVSREGRARPPQHARVAGIDTEIESALHEQGTEQRQHAVERDEHESEREPFRPRSDEPEELEPLGGFGGRELAVDLGLVLGRRQPVELGEQLGRGGERARHATAGTPGTRTEPRHRRHIGLGDGSVSVGGDPRRRRGFVVRRRRTHVARRVAPALIERLVEGGTALVGPREQRAVALAALQELLVTPRVDDVALVDHHDASSQTKRRAAMRDEDRGAIGHQVTQRVVDRLFGRRIHRRGGIVEDQDPRIGEDGSGQGDPLTLAARQREPTFADDGVVTVGQRVDERLGTTGASRGAYFFVGCVGFGVGDVGADRVREEERIFEHDSDLAAKRGEGDVTHVDPVDQYPALRHVVEAGQQRGDRGLARSAGSDERDDLAGLDVQVELIEHRRAPRVAEAHAFESDVAAHRG